MDERLLIEATPALLDGWCGPVVLRGCCSDADGCGDTVHGPDGVYCYTHGFKPASHTGWVVRLDLARAECRDRVARVLAATVLDADLILTSAPRFFCCWTREGQWALEAELIRHAKDGSRSGGTTGGTWRKQLADLDPHDDTRLPEGSRLVDALALAAVWREVSRG